MNIQRKLALILFFTPSVYPFPSLLTSIRKQITTSTIMSAAAIDDYSDMEAIAAKYGTRI
jgi:hypothetical protein